jgi:hypothetical protein
MVIRKTMSNMEIYNIASALVTLQKKMSEEQMVFPVKVNFYFQKNTSILVDMAQDLDEERSNIIMKFGTPSESNPEQIEIPKDKVEEVNGQLGDLFSLEQEVAVNVIDLDWFDGVNMTPAEFAAISFMIKDEE